MALWRISLAELAADLATANSAAGNAPSTAVVLSTSAAAFLKPPTIDATPKFRLVNCPAPTATAEPMPRSAVPVVSKRTRQRGAGALCARHGGRRTADLSAQRLRG